MNPRAREQVENEVDEARVMQRQKDAWLDDFFATKEQQLWGAFKNTAIGDADALVNIHHAAKSLGSLKQEVQTVMDTGKLAQAAINLDTNQK